MQHSRAFPFVRNRHEMQTMNRRETWQKQLEVPFFFSFLALTEHFLPHTPFHTYSVRGSQIAQRTRSHKHGVMTVPPTLVTLPPSPNWHKLPHGPHLIFPIVSLPSLSAFIPKQRGRPFLSALFVPLFFLSDRRRLTRLLLIAHSFRALRATCEIRMLPSSVRRFSGSQPVAACRTKC